MHFQQPAMISTLLLQFILLCTLWNNNLCSLAAVLPTDSIIQDANIKDLENLLGSLSDENCIKQQCKHFESEETHLNFINYFHDLKLILDDLSHDTLRHRLENKNASSTNRLFHFLLSNYSKEEFDSFITETLTRKLNETELHRMRRVKRGFVDTVKYWAEWVWDKVKNVDWGTMVKRAGQAFTVFQAVRSVTDPTQIAINAASAVGKVLVTEAVEDKIDDLWENKIR